MNFFKVRTNIKINTKYFLLDALAKSATAEGIEILNLSADKMFAC